MPRGPRITYPNAVFHIINRFVDRHPFFRNDEDFEWFLEMYFRHAKTFNILTYAYSLLPNHFHFVAETSDGEISRFLQRWLTEAAQGLNRRWGRVGRVFEGRTKTLLVESDQYFDTVIGYTLTNRLRANLAEDVFSDPWNSVNEMLSKTESRLARPQLWQYLFGYEFDHRDATEHLKDARRWLRQLDVDSIETEFVAEHRGGFLATQEFRKQVLGKIERRNEDKGGNRRKTDIVPKQWSLNSMAVVAHECSQTPEVVPRAWRNRTTAEQHIFWYLASRVAGFTFREITEFEAKRGRNGKSAAMALKRLENHENRLEVVQTAVARCNGTRLGKC